MRTNILHLKKESVLFGVAQWTECRHMSQRVAGSILSLGTWLGCGPGPYLVVHERQPHIDVSLPPFLAPFLSL